MHMIDVMNKLKEIAESGYDNEDIQRGIDAASKHQVEEAEVVVDEAVTEEEAVEEDAVEEANGRSELQAAYGAVYEYVDELDDEALEYVDRYAPDFSNAMDQYYSIADIEANSTPEQIQHYISELKDVESELAEITSESVEEANGRSELQAAYGAVYEYVDELDDEALEYVDRYAPDFSMAMDQYGGIADIEANSTPEQIQHYISELKDVESELAEITSESVEEVHEDVEEDTSLADMLKLAGRSGVMGLSQNNIIAESLELDEEDEVGETVEVPVSALSELMRLAGYENYESKINEYENDPEEEYMDVEDQMIGLSGGLNGPKKAYAAAAGGDNAMAQEPTEVEESLEESFYKEYSQMIEELKDAD